jgi:hypothetical protein
MLPEIEVNVTLAPTEFGDGFELQVSSTNPVSDREEHYAERLPVRQVQRDGLFQTILVEAFEKFYARVASNAFRERIDEVIEQTNYKQ